jgi:hypothetical protein
MKKLTFLLIIGSFLAFSCTKEEVTANGSTITGEWQWIMSTGGIAGTTITPASAGYKRKLVLSSDFKYYRYKNDVLEKSGTFEIVKAQSIYKVELVDFIKYDDDTMSVIESVTTDKLLLADNFYDGFGETFKRINK